MIVAGNMETRRFLEGLREEADELKDLRRKAKKDRRSDETGIYQVSSRWVGYKDLEKLKCQVVVMAR